MMTPEDFANGLREILINWPDDVDIAHSEADLLIIRLLRENGYGEGATLFARMEKWYS